jgi:hypothetical protein
VHVAAMVSSHLDRIVADDLAAGVSGSHRCSVPHRPTVNVRRRGHRSVRIRTTGHAAVRPLETWLGDHSSVSRRRPGLCCASFGVLSRSASDSFAPSTRRTICSARRCSRCGNGSGVDDPATSSAVGLPPSQSHLHCSVPQSPQSSPRLRPRISTPLSGT